MHGVDEERLEGSALALAGGCVDGGRHAADEGGDEQEHGQDAERVGGGLLGRGQIDLGEGERTARDTAAQMSWFVIGIHANRALG